MSRAYLLGMFLASLSLVACTPSTPSSLDDSGASISSASSVAISSSSVSFSTMPLGSASAASLSSIAPSNAVGAYDIDRRYDTATLGNAIFQYVIDHRGMGDLQIPLQLTEVCRQDTADCGDRVKLDVLLGGYLVRIPIDKEVPASHPGTGYAVARNADGTITVQSLKSPGIGSTR